MKPGFGVAQPSPATPAKQKNFNVILKTYLPGADIACRMRYAMCDVRYLILSHICESDILRIENLENSLLLYLFLTQTQIRSRNWRASSSRRPLWLPLPASFAVAAEVLESSCVFARVGEGHELS